MTGKLAYLPYIVVDKLLTSTHPPLWWMCSTTRPEVKKSATFTLNSSHWKTEEVLLGSDKDYGQSQWISQRRLGVELRTTSIFAGYKNTGEKCSKRHTSIKLLVRLIVWSCFGGAGHQLQRTENKPNVEPLILLELWILPHPSSF